MVMGSTNVGKTTFLNNLLGIGATLLTNEDRETTCFWNIKIREKSAYDLPGLKPLFEFRAIMK